HRKILLSTVAVTSIVAASGASAQTLAPIPVGCSSTFDPATNAFSIFQAPVVAGVVGATNSITSVIGTVNTAFLAQGSAFVANPEAQQADQTSGGVWSRVIGGRVNTGSTGTFNGSLGFELPGSSLGNGPGTIGCKSDIRQDYGGFQLGQDLARLNFGGSGA